MDPEFGGKPTTAQPNRAHRRTQSETFFSPDFDDDILLDDVVSDFNLHFSPSPSPNTHFNRQPQSSIADSTYQPKQLNPLSHHRSLSVDADFFNNRQPQSSIAAEMQLPTKRGLSADGEFYNRQAQKSIAIEMSIPQKQSLSVDGEFYNRKPQSSIAMDMQLVKKQGLSADGAQSSIAIDLSIPARQSLSDGDFYNRQPQSSTAMDMQLPKKQGLSVDGDIYNRQPQSSTDMEMEGAKVPASESKQVNQLSHYRSLSVDADFFAGLDIGGASWNSLAEAGEAGEGGHRRRNSVDGSSSASSFEAVDSSKKAMAPEKLAQLALSDPQKAKRILANRQSAARSKERKVRYTSELERKVQTLQAEATTLSTQVTKLQRDTTGLSTENKELRLRLEALEQQAHLRDALNEALKEELKHLKMVAGEVQVVNGNGSLYYTQPHTFNSFRGSQPQYAQQQKQQQSLHVPDVNQNLSRHPQPNFQGFNQRA